jgi:hypothetical protein
MGIVGKTGTLELCVVVVVTGLSLKYGMQFRSVFRLSVIFLNEVCKPQDGGGFEQCAVCDVCFPVYM